MSTDTKLRPVLRIALLLVIGTGLALALSRGRPGPGNEPVSAPYTPEWTNAELRGAAFRLVESRIGVMGTRFVIELAATDEPTARKALVAAWERIHGLEQAMSTWIAESTLSRVNRLAAGTGVVVDPDTLACLLAARDTFRESGGAFDPTVGPLVALWRPLSRLPAPPDDAEISAALALVGFDRVRLDPVDHTVRFEVEGIALDVGGIAKGYAADRATEAAIDAGAIACRVNAGGDQTARGAPPWALDGFEVTVRDPDAGEQASLPDITLRLLDRAAATSGNYERYTEIAGERFSHIVDPRTGRPVPDAVAQVTVLAPTGTMADALATALTVLGPREGLALAAAHPDVEALFLVRHGEGWRRIASEGFPGGPR